MVIYTIVFSVLPGFEPSSHVTPNSTQKKTKEHQQEKSENLWECYNNIEWPNTCESVPYAKPHPLFYLSIKTLYTLSGTRTHNLWFRHANIKVFCFPWALFYKSRALTI